MQKLHRKLTEKSNLYQKWHSHPYHSHLHWLCFINAFFVALILILFQIELTFEPVEFKVNVSEVKAQTATVVINGAEKYQTIEVWGDNYSPLYGLGSQHTNAWYRIRQDIPVNVVRQHIMFPDVENVDDDFPNTSNPNSLINMPLSQFRQTQFYKDLDNVNNGGDNPGGYVPGHPGEYGGFKEMWTIWANLMKEGIKLIWGFGALPPWLNRNCPDSIVCSYGHPCNYGDEGSGADCIPGPLGSYGGLPSGVRAGLEDEYVEWVIGQLRWFRDKFNLGEEFSKGLIMVDAWNEPDISVTHTDVSVYRKIVKKLSVAIRNHPELDNVKILAPTVGHSGWRFNNYMSSELVPYIDLIDYHNYHDDLNDMGSLRDWVNSNAPGKSVWTTEGYQLSEWDYSESGRYNTQNGGLSYRMGLDLAIDLYNDLTITETSGYIHFWFVGGISGGFGERQDLYDYPNVNLMAGFYGLKQYYNFIKIGSIRRGSSSNNNEVLPTAFLHPDGDFSLVVINKGGQKTVNFNLNNLSGILSLHRFRTTPKCNSSDCLDSLPSDKNSQQPDLKTQQISDISLSGASFTDILPAYSITTYTTQDVEPPPTCTCTSWQNDRCGGGSCPQNQMHQIGTNCTPSGCSLDRCVDDPSCIISNIRSDLNCDGKVNVYDFGILLSRWTFDQANFDLEAYKTTSFYQACKTYFGGQDHDHIPDLNDDQIVNVSDFGILVSQWNP